MKTTARAPSRRRSPDLSAVSQAGRFSIFGFIGWVWFPLVGDSVWKGVTFVAVLGLAAVVGITWYAFRARADRRWRAVLDRYAEQEMAKRTHPRRGHRF
jgi:hypothetical protein